MVKLQSNSTIEIWSRDYINLDEKRKKTQKIIQIEPSGSPDEYIVEFVKLKETKIYD